MRQNLFVWLAFLALGGSRAHAQAALLDEARMKEFATGIGYVVKAHDPKVTPNPVRYAAHKPEAVEEYALKAVQEWPKEAKTYARYYVQFARFKSPEAAKAQTPCRSVQTDDHAWEKSRYALCKGFTFGLYNVEVLTDGALFVYGGEQQRVTDALQSFLAANTPKP